MASQIAGIFDHEKKTKIVVQKKPVPDTFWCGNYFYKGTKNVTNDGDSCCFNHYVGMPIDEHDAELRHPLYNYQEEIIDYLKKGELYFWILKSPKLGITEFWLRFIVWKCMIDPSWQHGQIALVVGTGKSPATIQLDRVKHILDNEYNAIDYSDTQFNNRSEFILNTIHIKAHPANNINSIRSQTKMKFIFIDEGAFFIMENDAQVQEAVEHYGLATHAYMVYVSTAGEKAEGFMYDIGENPEEDKYIKIWLTDPEKYGLKKHKDSGTSIYDRKRFEKFKDTPGFERNYLGKWGAGSGNAFDTEEIEKITETYEFFNPSEHPSVLAIDPAYGASKGASKFALLGMVRVNGVLYTNHQEELKNPSNRNSVNAIERVMGQGYKEIVIDSAGASLIPDLEALGYKVTTMNFNEQQKFKTSMTVIRVNDDQIPKENLKMLIIAQKMIKDRTVRVHRKHKLLLDQLRSLTLDKDGMPNKKKVSFDLGDCFRMACKHMYLTDFVQYIV